MARSVPEPAATTLARAAMTSADAVRMRRQLAHAEDALASELQVDAARCEHRAQRVERALNQPTTPGPRAEGAAGKDDRPV